MAGVVTKTKIKEKVDAKLGKTVFFGGTKEVEFPRIPMWVSTCHGGSTILANQLGLRAVTAVKTLNERVRSCAVKLNQINLFAR